MEDPTVEDLPLLAEHSISTDTKKRKGPSS